MRPECARAAAAYGLVLPRSPLSGRAGERLGRAPGASLEFMDFRDYVPGDDLRHVDWRTYARTDQLKIRLFREEISPSVDIVADLSPSMAVTPAKERALRDLVAAACAWTRRGCGVPRRLAAGGNVFEDEETVGLDGPADGRLFPADALRTRSLRVVISDFLFRGDPGPGVRRFAANASHLYVVQLLDPWELDPAREGPCSLVDCESEARLDLVLDARTVDAYRQRLQRLRVSLERAVRGAGGTYACVPAAAPAVMFRQSLMPQGVVEPV